MTLAEWIATGIGSAGLIVSVAGWWTSNRSQVNAMQKLSEERGRDLQRLSALETWQQSKSIDRSEFQGLTLRVDGMEREVDRVCDQVAEVSKQVAVSDARLVGLSDLMKAQGEALSHQMKNLRMSFEAAAPASRRRSTGDA